MKRKSAAQQKAEDLAYMREIIKDNRRLRSLRSSLPDMITNDKDLLSEITEALRESSSTEEYIPSDWEFELETNTPNAEGRDPAQQTDQIAPEQAEAGPSRPTYFDKGKWTCDDDFEAQMAYKEAKSRPNHESRTMPKKDRPSIGITLDDIRPPKKVAKINTPDVTRELKSGIAALPEGGYFADKMRAKNLDTPRERKSRNKHAYSSSERESSDSPDSSDSEESTTSSSSTSSISDERRQRNAKNRAKYRQKEKTRKEQRENRRLRRQIRELKRASIKIKEPTSYRGQNDYDAFEKWDYEVDHWLRASGYKGTRAVEHLGTFLAGTASRWYMDFVAPNPKLYTVDSLKMGLFSYFFPPDLKSKLRREFKFARQGSQKFVDYLQALKRLQRRLPDITDNNIYNKLWDTVHAYIKVKCIEAGLNKEETDLETLTEMAERFEAAEEAKRRTFSHGKPKGDDQNTGSGANSKQTHKAPEQNLKGEPNKQGSTLKAQNGGDGYIRSYSWWRTGARGWSGVPGYPPGYPGPGAPPHDNVCPQT